MAERLFPLAGDVDLATAAEIQAKLMVLVNITTDDLVLDCTDVQFIDSMGISVFVYIQQVLEVQGRALRIEGMSERVRRPFDILDLSEPLGIDVLDRI